VLVAPLLHFTAELERLKLIDSAFQAKNLESQSGRRFTEQTTDAELADLSAALEKAKTPEDKAESIRSAHAAERAKLKAFLAAAERMNEARLASPSDENDTAELESSKTNFPGIAIVDDLPPEFADYFEGARDWHNPAIVDKAVARASWERLLARPAKERHYKSTWAAYMLAKSWEKDETAKAIDLYKDVRRLARRGFADSIGLAAASLGQEARLHLKAGKFHEAIDLYLEQLATGDNSAAESLRISAAQALEQPAEVLVELAKEPRTQRVISAYLASRSRGEGSDEEIDAQKSKTTQAWLNAVEEAGIADVGCAETLALAAYQHNKMQLAQRWIDRAPNSPVAQWLQAKLLLRAGKLDQAAALLAKVSRSFPIEAAGTNQIQTGEFKDSVYLDMSGYAPDTISAPRQVLGELGVLHLARSQYAQALDALLNAGFWMDAAYVGERVMTIDELKAYVDRAWPAGSAKQIVGEIDNHGERVDSPALMRQRIRYLLARRLMRGLRGDEARPYYPEELLTKYDALCRGLSVGWSEDTLPSERARALVEAAYISRTNGMELLGTELQPDYAVHGGEYEDGLDWQDRSTNSQGATIVQARPEEIQRASQHNADPEKRFHYRYQAAFLGWEAARLMPNDSEDTAKVLWKSGTWLKYQDPETADIFYKALVRRNRQTRLGSEADRQRWFPDLDANGQALSGRNRAALAGSRPAASTPEPVAVEPEDPQKNEEELPLMPSDLLVMADPGSPEEESDQNPLTLKEPGLYEYEVGPGDTLTSIVRNLLSLGVQASIEEIIAKNSIDPRRIQIGQKILIPEMEQR
jgi:hypothetical protein